MNEMIERVARIIDQFAWPEELEPIDDPGALAWVLPKDEADKRGRQVIARVKARAVIEAMREPTEAMVVAAHDGGACWELMIDAALKE